MVNFQFLPYYDFFKKKKILVSFFHGFCVVVFFNFFCVLLLYYKYFSKTKYQCKTKRKIRKNENNPQRGFRLMIAMVWLRQ